MHIKVTLISEIRVPLTFQIGAVMTSICSLMLLILLAIFDVVTLVGFEKTDTALSWRPHLAILLTLICIGVIIYILVLFGSYGVYGLYADAFFIIFLVMNVGFRVLYLNSK